MKYEVTECEFKHRSFKKDFPGIQCDVQATMQRVRTAADSV